MTSIERRRRRRKIVPIVSAVTAALVIALIVFLVIFISKRACSGGVTPDPTFIPSETPPDPTDTQEAAETPEQTRLTPAPTPSRVSPEMSFVMLSVEITKQEGGEGETLKSITGSCAVEFVNNTDVPLYCAEFNVSVLSVLNVTVNGVPARFTVEDGRLTVPFLDLLQRESSCDVYFTFEAVTDAGELSLFSFGYDTAFGLTAVIRSETGLTVDVPEAAADSDGRFSTITFEKATVHSVTVTFEDQ